MPARSGPQILTVGSRPDTPAGRGAAAHGRHWDPPCPSLPCPGGQLRGTASPSEPHLHQVVTSGSEGNQSKSTEPRLSRPGLCWPQPSLRSMEASREPLGGGGGGGGGSHRRWPLCPVGISSERHGHMAGSHFPWGTWVGVYSHRLLNLDVKSDPQWTEIRRPFKYLPWSFLQESDDDGLGEGTGF